MDRNESIARLLCEHVLGYEWNFLFKDRDDKLRMGQRKGPHPDWNEPTQAELIECVPGLMAALAALPREAPGDGGRA